MTMQFVVPFIIIWITVMGTVLPVGGTENAPAPPGPSVSPPSQAPAPVPEPPAQDPGIVKKPDVEPLPGSVVVPPVVDPKIAVNPDEPKQQEPPAPSEGKPDQRQPEQKPR